MGSTSAIKQHATKETAGLLLACAGLLVATMAESSIAFVVGSLLWVGLPTYWLAKNIGSRGDDDE